MLKNRIMAKGQMIQNLKNSKVFIYNSGLGVHGLMNSKQTIKYYEKDDGKT